MKKLVQLAGDTFLYGASTILGRLINWLLTPFYIRTLAQEEFGVVVNIYSFIAVLLVINTLGFETGYFRFVKTYKAKIVSHSLIFGIGIVSIVFFLIAYFLRSSLTLYLGDIKNAEEILFLAVFIIAFDALNSIPFAQFRFENKAVKYSLIRLLQIVLTIVFNVFYLVICPYLLRNGYSVPSFIFNEELKLFYVFLSNFLASLIILLILLPNYLFNKFTVSFKILIEVTKYSIPIVLVGIFGMINQNIDKILMPFLLKTDNPFKELAVYGANFKIGVLMALFTQSFRLAFEPFFFKEGSGSDSKVLYSQVLKYFSFLGMSIFLGVTLFMDLVNVVLTPEYYAGNNIIPLILLSQLFFGIYYSLSLWYKLTDKTIYGSFISFMGLAVNLIGLVVLVPMMGYYGAAISVCTSFFLMVIVSYLYGQKYYPINYPVKEIISLIVLALLLFYMDKNIDVSSLFLKYLIKGSIFVFYIVVFVIYEKVIKEKLRK